MALPTLLNTRSPLADAATQRATLDALPLARTFDEAAGGTPATTRCAPTGVTRPADERRQALQPGLPPLPRRCRARSHAR